MKVIDLIIKAFFTSATPNLFGSKKRREAKEKLAGSFREAAGGTQEEIERLKTLNPFESAAAKSAMAESSRKAKQTQQRFANIMGGNVNPEAMVAAQQATQEAVAGTAGDIATGAEANKAAQLAQLRGEKTQQLGQAAGIEMAAIDEQGQGWKDFFGAMESVGNLASAAGGVIGAI
jgi:hypothetical protein